NYLFDLVLIQVEIIKSSPKPKLKCVKLNRLRVSLDG
ncbi:hypothetical protein Goshw_023597, partial [Gossypium schwendimanii]|nr:hypothetical protein [Gossypium schwendimanii]